MVSVSTQMDLLGNRYIVFEVPIPNRPSVFMSMKVTEYNRDSAGVVIVDAGKFLQLWRNEPYSIHAEQANGNPRIWSRDYKYHKAVEGFSHGKEDPVPLADVSYRTEVRKVISYKLLWFGKSEHQEEFGYVGFTNGVTRTIWLLANGCAAFPVECEIPGALDLHRVAAATGTQFHTVGELLEANANA